MPIRELLKEVVDRADGVVGAVIMDLDGIAIDEYAAAGADDVHVAAVEYVAVLKEIRSATEVLRSGQLEEVAVSTATHRFVIRMLNDELFVMLCLLVTGNYGKARYLLMRYAPDFRLALS